MGQRRSARLAVVGALVAGLFGCDFGLGGGGGCLRISQGDYDFPVKRVLAGSVAARLTESGIDFITARVKALVLAFFDADANGRAVIPLGSLGLGAIGTSLGPFDAEVRDLVLTLDLSRLEVRLVPGSSPARLEVYVEDAEVGLVDGTISGGVNGTFFSGDAACGLADGPDGRVAKVTMRLVLELATDENGALSVRVLPSTFDLQDVALTLETDCDRPECLDGLAPGDSGECLECETICPVADFASDLASGLQDTFDDLLDGLLDLLADELANLVLDGVLNGRPLAVEGELDLAALLSPILSWTASARPLGVLARPAGDAFRITGAGPTLGLDVVLDAGLDAAPHPCVGETGVDRVFTPGPRPVFDGLALTAGGPVPYDLALGVSDAIVNEALWALWKSGALCIRATTDDLAAVSQGGLILTAATLDLLLPGAASLAGPDAPVRLSVLPRLAQGPDYVRFGEAPDPLLAVGLVDAKVAVEALVGEAWLRLVSFEADLELGVDLQPLTDGRLEIRVAEVRLLGLGLPDNELFAEARLEVIAPFVVELALGFLAERPLTFDLGLSGLVSGLGVPLDAVIAAMGPAGPDADWLAIYVQLRDPAPGTPRRAPRVEPVHADDAPAAARLGTLDFRANAAAGERFQVRVGPGRWSRTFTGPGPHRLEAAHLWLPGAWPLTTRAVDDAGRAGEPTPSGEVVVTRPEPAPPAAAPLITAAPPTPAPAPGCASGGPAPLLALLAFTFTRARSRRRALATIAATLGALATLSACAGDAAPERTCTRHAQCDDGFLCGPGGTCTPSTACADDAGCCPGAVCFSGWCRPTSECDASRPCAALGEVCENDQCVPAACDALGACPEPLSCVAGRCVYGTPCGGRCSVAGGGLVPGEASACDLASGRCLPLVEPCVCPAGFAIAVTAGDALTCTTSCACAPLPALPAAEPGVDGALVPNGALPALVSYDPAYGDLALSRFLDPAGARLDQALDGLPEPGAAPPLAAPEGYRGGVLDPGPDRGARPAVNPREDGRVDVLYRDRDRSRVLYGRFDLASGARVLSAELPLEGRAPQDGEPDLGLGRFSCLARRPDGTLAGLVFAPADPSDTVALLSRVESRVPDPASAADWAVTTVLESPLPARSERPCANACGLGDACVLDGGLEACAAVLDVGNLGQSPCPPCGAHEICAEVAGVRACRPKVERRYDADRLPWGEGLFATCATTPGGEVVGAWYDADRRRLVVGRWPFGAADRQVLDEGRGRDPGHFASIAAHAGGLGVAYQDAATSELRAAFAASIAGPWRFETLALGAGHGAWAHLAFDGGRAVVVATEAEAGDVWLFARGEGCWGERAVFTEGTFGHPSLVLDPAVPASPGELWVSALRWRFDEDLAPRHAPALARVGLPACVR